MHYILLLLLLEGFKKLWVETSDQPNRRSIIALHPLLFGIYVIYSIYAYTAPDNPYEGITPDDYDGGIVIRPKETQENVENLRHKEAIWFYISNWFFSLNGSLFFIALTVPVYHSHCLLKNFASGLKENYKTVGRRLTQLFIASPFLITSGFCLASVLDTHGYSTEPYKGFGYVFLLSLFFYMLLALSFNRLSNKGIYRPNWAKTVGYMFLCGFISFVIVVLIVIYGISTTDFSN